MCTVRHSGRSFRNPKSKTTTRGFIKINVFVSDTCTLFMLYSVVQRPGLFFPLRVQYINLIRIGTFRFSIFMLMPRFVGDFFQTQKEEKTEVTHV